MCKSLLVIQTGRSKWYHLKASVQFPKAIYWSKIVLFYTLLHSTPPLGGPRQNIGIPFGVGKLEWSGYPMVKNFDDMFSRFDRILACDGQTDRRTDILPRHSPRYAYASRGKMYHTYYYFYYDVPH